LEFGVWSLEYLELEEMENKEFSKKLEDRTKKFAISIIKLSVSLPGSPEGKVIRNQITKSGTSIGANYREANRAKSRADFINKIKICESEASETIYWLEIISDLNWLDSLQVEGISTEANEILSIYTSVGKKLKL
jgi:four helix bundle protein